VQKAVWWNKRTLLGGIALVLLTWILYAQVSHFDFVNLDDDDYVASNVHVQAGLTWDTLRWAATSREASNWHPLTWISHSLDWGLFGGNPAGHHLTSVLFHSLDVLILFLGLTRVTGRSGRSLVVAALFAVHPLNVESVAWIAERKSVLSAFFFLLALVAYGWYGRKPGLARYLMVLGLFILALGSKPMVITLPCVLLLLDVWPLARVSGWTQPSEVFPAPQRTVRQLLLEKLPLFACSAASAAITLIASRATVPVNLLPLSARVENALYSYAIYIWKAFWPAGLAAFHPYQANGLSATSLALSGIFLGGVGLIAWRKRRTTPELAVCCLWYLGMLVPVIGIIQVGAQAWADRYAYLPLLGIFVMVVWSVGDLLDRYTWGVRLGAVLAAVVVFALSLVAWRQIGYWQNSEVLWSHALAVTKNNEIAERCFGEALLSSGREDEAIEHLDKAVQMLPADPETHRWLGASLQGQGRYREAAQEYEIELRLADDPVLISNAQANLGFCYTVTGNARLGAELYEHAFQTDRKSVERVIENLSRMANETPSSETYLRLGLLLYYSGRRSAGRAACEQALAIQPNSELIESVIRDMTAGTTSP